MKKKSKRKKPVKKFFSSVFMTAMCLVIIIAFLLYGPIAFFREMLITTAMTTYSHQWLATNFFDSATIERILSKNTVIEPDDSTDPTLIGGNVIVNKDDPLHRRGNELFNILELKQDGYVGYMVAIYDPSSLSMGVSRYLGTEGEFITKASAAAGAKLAFNASGFADDGGKGNGGIPSGLIVQNGKIVYDEAKNNPGHKHNVIGFNKKNILVLQKLTTAEVISNGIVNAVEFKPFLIVNGEAALYKGNGGWGLAPRTGLGQRKDGTLLFLVIDGRQTHSVGATVIDVMELMQKYGAYNAANLDGGSSSILVMDGKIHNKVSSKSGERAVPAWWMIS